LHISLEGFDMIITPQSTNYLNNSDINSTEQWSVFGFSIAKFLNQNQIFEINCDDIFSGLASLVRLQNVNGKYSKSTLSYNNHPVYINSSQTALVVGPTYGIGTDIQTLSIFEQINISNNPNDYEIYRDGPYLLGKFNSDGSWAIARFPDSYDGQNIVDIDTLSSENLLESLSTDKIIVLNQVNTDSEIIKLKEYRTGDNDLPKKYEEWLNSSFPNSRNWQINPEFATSACIGEARPVYHNGYKALLHFSYNNDSITPENKITRYVPDIKSGVSINDVVDREYSLLMSYLDTKFYDDLIKLVPQKIVNFNPTITVIEDLDYDKGYLTEIGSILDNGIYEEASLIQINGEFLNIGNVKSMIYGGKFTINSITNIISNTVITKDQYKTHLDNKFLQTIDWIEQNMTKWVRNFAFLIDPPLFKNEWLTTTKILSPIKTATSDVSSGSISSGSVSSGSFTDNPTGSDSIYASKHNNRIFSTEQERDYYDALFDYIKIKGYAYDNSYF